MSTGNAPSEMWNEGAFRSSLLKLLLLWCWSPDLKVSLGFSLLLITTHVTGLIQKSALIRTKQHVPIRNK